jgi:CBS domain-containing protein
MARYGRDYGRGGWQGGGGDFDRERGGWGGGLGAGGGVSRGGFGGSGLERGGAGRGEYGGMGSDGGYRGGPQRSGFGSGGGAYDTEYGGMHRGGGQGGDELRRMRASEVMTDDPETVTADASLMEAARKMKELDVGIIPVVESASSRRLKGVITDRDIAVRAVAEGKDANSTTVGDVMTTRVQTCNKNDSLRDVMRVMETEQVRRVPITDREGRLVGIIAQADVAMDVDSPRGRKRVARTLESISEPGEPRGRSMGGSRAGHSRGRE